MNTILSLHWFSDAKLYKQSPTLNLYVAPCDDSAILCLAGCHSFPVSSQGNATPTKPHKLRHLKASAFQHGIADAADVDGRRGSNV